MKLCLLALLAGCGSGNRGEARDDAHPGEPAVRSRGDLSDSSAAEIALLQYLIEHEWTIGSLVRGADGRELTDTTRAALKHAERHRFENEADLVAARQGYGGGRRSPVPPPREPPDRLDQFKGREYERVLLTRLIGHYAEEVAAIDTALPRIREEHVRVLMDRIRAQRLHDIHELATKSQSD